MNKEEMKSLNLDDLDIEELERRLELAACAAECSCCNNKNECSLKAG